MEQNPTADPHHQRRPSQVSVLAQRRARPAAVPDLSRINPAHPHPPFPGPRDVPPIGTVTEDYDDAVQNSIVLGPRPTPRAIVARNISVDFVVSRGTEPPGRARRHQPPRPTAQPPLLTLDLDPAARAQTYTVTRSQDGNTQDGRAGPDSRTKSPGADGP